MKSFIAFAALVSVCIAAPATVAPDPDLVKDLGDFLKCIDLTGVITDVSNAEDNDKQVADFIDWMDTDGFKKPVEAIDEEKTYLDILNDLEKIDVPAYLGVNKALEFLNIKKIVPPSLKKSKAQGLGSIHDLIAKIEKDDIKFTCVNDTYADKTTGEGHDLFKKMDAHLHSKEFAALVEAFKNSEPFKNAITLYKEKGLDLEEVIQLFLDIFHLDW